MTRVAPPSADTSHRRRHVVITGGARGIGAALVAAFAALGDNVTFSYRQHSPALEHALQTMSSHAPRPIQCDMSDVEQVRRFLDDAVAGFGPPHVLINNAGIVRDRATPFASDEDWHQVLRTNLDAAFYTTRHLARDLMRSHGSIINISSVAAAHPHPGQANYAASKGAIEAFTRAVAKELGPMGVRVNAIAPGFVQTDMTAHLDPQAVRLLERRVPLRRLGRVRDVSDLAVFLASDNAQYLTGQVLTLDGGLTL